MPRHHYALEYPYGPGVNHADTGKPLVKLARFTSPQERDLWVDERAEANEWRARGARCAAPSTDTMIRAALALQRRGLEPYWCNWGV
jgi:hypothetical protein